MSPRAQARGVDADAYGFAEPPKSSARRPLQGVARVRSGVGLLYTNAPYDISFMQSPTSYTVAEYAQPRTGLAYVLDLTLGLIADRDGLVSLGANYRGHWRPSVPDVAVERAIGLHSRFTLVHEILGVADVRLPGTQWVIGQKVGVGLLREYLGPVDVTASNTAYVLGGSLARIFPLSDAWRASLAFDATVHGFNPFGLVGRRLVETAGVTLSCGLELR